MYPLLILSLVSVEDDGNGDRDILCATFEALANPFTTTGICIPNAVVAKEGNDNVRFRLPYLASSKIILASGTIAVPAPTSSRTAETKGLIILNWTTGAFLRNPIAEVSTPIIGLDSAVSSDERARAGAL